MAIPHFVLVLRALKCM